MEFFSWLQIMQTLLIPIGFSDTMDTAQAVAITYQRYWICVGISAGLFVLCLLLTGFGLYKLAKRAGLNHPWFGFVPILNTVFLGKLAGEAQFFGQKMKRAGLYAAIVEAVSVVYSVFFVAFDLYFLQFAELVPQTSELLGSYQGLEIDLQILPAGLRWICAFANSVWAQVISGVITVAQLALFCVLFLAFFRKYYARNPVMMTVLSALFSFRGFTIFAVRNNAPLNYDDYVRNRMEEMARRSQSYGPGGYGQGGYGQGGYGQGGYGQGGNGQGNSSAGAPEDPFGDFSQQHRGASPQDPPHGSPQDDPFSDF